MINGKLSSQKTITCGVPQGSILGPLLFLLYINDMPESLNYSTPSLYADDTEIYASCNDCGDLVHKINNDLENIRKWMIKNKLQIHPSKSKHMFIASAYNLKNKLSDSPILINNKPIPKIDHYSCLGVDMDERMSWEKHVECICSKVSAGIGAMRRLKPFVPLSTLKMLYNAIIQPYFDYCSPPHSQKRASCHKSVDILQQTCYQQADIRMRSHGLRQLVDNKSVASCQQT